MSRFNESAADDSFDDILATIDVPTNSTTSQSVGTKKARFSFESDDSILANVSLPEATTSTQSTTKPANAPPISAGKTNCVLVNPKQRGNPCQEDLLEFIT